MHTLSQKVYAKKYFRPNRPKEIGTKRKEPSLSVNQEWLSGYGYVSPSKIHYNRILLELQIRKDFFYERSYLCKVQCRS